MKKDNDKLAKEMGISKELTEHTGVEARVYNDFSEYGWVIHIHPPTERKDLIYFKIYKGFQCPAEVGLWTASNCTRISMLKPEYINCSDSSIKSWILNEDERNHLCSIISEIWDKLLFDYSRELTWLFGTDMELGLAMPDYSKLPINGHSSMGSWGMKKGVSLNDDTEMKLDEAECQATMTEKRFLHEEVFENVRNAIYGKTARDTESHL